MKELFFKVVYAEEFKNFLTLTETRQNPTFSLFIADYKEKLINVMYKPAEGFDEKQFIQLIRRKLKRKFHPAKVEHLENQNKLSSV